MFTMKNVSFKCKNSLPFYSCCQISNSRLNPKFFVCMEDCLRLLKPLIMYEVSTVSKKFLMKGPCVIFCGQTQMIVVVGVCHPGVLDTLLGRYF